MPTPWLDDACSLVDAYRAGELSPREATQECLDAIAASPLNAFSHVDPEAALAEADAADVSRPFGGVPVAVKELEKVDGWPHTYASLPLKGTLAEGTSTQVRRLVDAGAVRLGQTTASEAGLVGYTSSKLHGTTRNPYDPTRTPGGSSGGTAAAVAGGLAPIGSGSDGGGSIRIPAGYTGLVGLKTSFRRIPFGPLPQMEPLTSTVGCLSRSVRDSARWLDVCNGPDGYDPFALPRVEGYEQGLGTVPLEGLRVVIAPDLGGTAVVHPQVRAVVEEAAEVLVKAAGLRQVDVDLRLPMLDQRWAIPAMPVLFAGLAPFWPDIRPMLTDEVAAMMDVAAGYDVGLAGLVEPFRLSVIEAWGRIFEQADLVICATNPDDAFAAEGPSPTRVGELDVEGWNAGRLTMGANLASLPAISLPAGTSAAGLPVGLQVYAPRHRDDLLLELGLVMERERPWALVAPSAGAGSVAR